MTTNYDDARLTDVEVEKEKALDEVDYTYNDMIEDSDSYYQSQIDATKEWEQKQTELQQAQTDFAIEQIEQQKEKTEKDYIREQSGAYTDWQKQSGQYGANAEAMASSGLANSGYSESSQVSMYNTYQNRVASARESFNQAVLSYDNMIKEAQLQNNSIKAEIAYQSLQKQLEIALQGFQYENQLLLEQLSTKMSVEQMYHSRYQDVLNQINQENALAEEKRQFDTSFEEEKRQFDASLEEEQRQFDKQYEAAFLDKDSSGGSSGESGENDNLFIDKYKGTLTTDYYKGAYNPACKEYGTFSNGYQPKGVIHNGKDYGKVTKTGMTQEAIVTKLDGTKVVVNQNIWQTPDGSYWLWNGMKNQYVKLGYKRASNGGGDSSNAHLGDIGAKLRSNNAR